MNIINLPEKIKESCENTQDIASRGYLGMSEIGHACDAKLYLSFRMASPSKFDATTLFRFEDGHYSEALTIKRINLIPVVNLQDKAPNGKQFVCSDFGGHFVGHVDGIIEFGDTRAVWEHKCIGEKYFIKLQKAIEAGKVVDLGDWDNNYFAQAQCYMHYFGLDTHITTVASAGSRDYLQLVTKYDIDDFHIFWNKARRIIEAEKAPEKINTSEIYPCTFCNHRGVCHQGAAPDVNCRTCISSFPITNASVKYSSDMEKAWFCTRHKRVLNLTDQLQGCYQHLYDPQLLSYSATQIDAAENTIKYERKSDYKIFENKLENGITNSRNLGGLLHA